MKSFNVNSIIDPAILELGSEIRLKNGEILSQQFGRANDFYLLKSGKVKFYLSLSDEDQEFEVGESGQKLTPVGWSGFNPPGRYATTVKVYSHHAIFYKWDHQVLKEYFDAHHDAAMNFLREMNARARDLIKIAVEKLSTSGPSLIHESIPKSEEFRLSEPLHQEEFVQFLGKSSFFEVFDETPLEFLGQGIERRVYAANAVLYHQNTPADGIYILDTGKVRFSYQGANETTVSFRQIDTPGFVLGWSSAVGKPNIINAHAVRETTVHFIPQKTLDRVFRLNPDFAPKYFRRLLWLISHQLQAIRARVIASSLDTEVIAISNLIDQNSARLTLSSPLHKIPHLLDNKLTVADALNTLENLRENGTTLEKTVALTALDILDEIKKEQDFYAGLVNVYNGVVKAPPELGHSEVRKICAQEYENVFSKTNYIITGKENLPDEPGNIFIYNHLRNHPYNTLPNQFQITLDSHFISAMVLFPKYGDPGLRIVRVGLSKEYAHQEYYQRQGHIDVFTQDSGKITKKRKEQVRQMFYNTSGEYLQNGGNLIISPEGNSYSTDESPGPFKAGAFSLALSMKKEPWIVPLAMANFEKRVRNNVFSCIVLPPFRASDHIKNPESKEEIKRFLESYQQEYRGYVDLALKQAENAPKTTWKNQ